MMMMGTQESGALTAVAIDKDKNSLHAVKWTIENLPNKSRNIILVHVVVVSQPTFQSPDCVPKEGRPPTDEEVQNFFLPFRGFCARKGVTAKEVILVGADVTNALAEYICACCISNIVLGTSSRSVLTRAFKNVDVPTSLGKSVPDFCSVYAVSSRGRVQNIRSATRPPTPATCTRQSSRSSLTMSFPDTPSSGDLSSQSIWKYSGSSAESSFDGSGSDNAQMAPYLRQLGSKNMPSQNKIPYPAFPVKNNNRGRTRDTSFCSSTDSELSGPTNYSSSASFEPFEHSATSEASGHSLSSVEEDEEIKRLKQELKNTLDRLNEARTHANLQQKSDETGRLEYYKLTQESALATMERKKYKSKAVEESNNDMQYRRYAIEEIEAATNYFAKSEKIGEGGYGPVYKAIMDRTAVAIKVLRPDIPQGHKQFQQEIEVLSRIRHPNMVLLLGACDEYGCLVYEYMENGSLDDRLFCKNNTPPIPWYTRFKIAAEIATALNFLHQAKPAPLVHRDLKPANILLDRNYVSKISDVGLARLVPPSVADCVTQYQVTAAAGTFCYIDPEYQQTGKLSTKSDIYSLGVLLLQIITARAPMGLTHHVERAIEMGKFEDILDPAARGWPVQDALSYARLALKCCELKGKDRPQLGSVILPELERLRDLSFGAQAKGGGFTSAW